MPLAHVVLHDRIAAAKSVLVSQPLEEPLRRVTLLAVRATIFLEDPVDDAGEPIQLGTMGRTTPAVR